MRHIILNIYIFYFQITIPEEDLPRKLVVFFKNNYFPSIEITYTLVEKSSRLKLAQYKIHMAQINISIDMNNFQIIIITQYLDTLL